MDQSGNGFHHHDEERRLLKSNQILTVALILGTSVPKGSKMAITAEINVIAQN